MPTDEKKPMERVMAWFDRAGMLAVLGALLVVSALFVPNFGRPENIGNLLRQVSTVGMVATTMVFCLASGNFDLSVGTVIPCAGVLCALLLKLTGSLAVAIPGALAFGALVGGVNGFVIARLRINPLIATLSTMMIVRGLGFVFADFKSIGIDHENFLRFANLAFPSIHSAESGRTVFEVTTPVWTAFALLLFFGFVLHRTVFGRDTLAIGGNEDAARLAGIGVTRIKIVIFTMQGVVAAVAGVLLAGQFGVGDPKTAQGSELSIIAACVLGGVSLTGGVGRMSHVVAGVFIMGVVENAMSLLAIDSSFQYIVRGAVLLLAVVFDRFRRKDR